MSKKTVTLQYIGGEYVLGEGIKDNNEIFLMCADYFEKVVKVIGVPRRVYKELYSYPLLKILSINFVGLKKANKDSKDLYFITKDADEYEEFKVWAKNPNSLWDERYEQFTNPYNDDFLLLRLDKYSFERITGIRKRATLQIGDVYSFRRIDVRVKKI